MAIIDAQIHRVQLPRPWGFGDESGLGLAVELAREGMDAVGVDAALINSGADFIDAAVAAYPGRFAGSETVQPGRPDLRDHVAGYRDRPGRLALRVTVRDWVTGTVTEDYESGRLTPIFAAAEDAGLPIFLSAQGQPQAAEQVARDFPGLTLILDHLGLPQPPPMKVADDPWELLPAFVALAKYPNVAVKFCGGLTLARQPFPHRDAWPHLMTMVEAYGPDRLMWASDYTRMRMATGTVELGPRSRWATTYLDSFAFVRDTDELTATEKAAILGGTIQRLLRWEPTGE